MHGTVIAALLIASLATSGFAVGATANPSDPALKRRADLGAAIALPEEGAPARVLRFRPGSALEKAGIAAGDQIIRLDGKPVATAQAFLRVTRTKREGDTLTVTTRRGEQTFEHSLTLPGMPFERVDGVTVRYGEARSEKGYRVRTYISRPANATGRLPVVVFIPWLSCDAVEAPFGPGGDGWKKMLQIVMRDSGAQVVRIEKPGVGDSEGPDCAVADLEHDMAGFRAGIRAALADPGADPKRLVLVGGSIGGALAVVLARDFEPIALASLGSFSRSWIEHILAHERRRLTLSGQKPAEVNAAMKLFPAFYDLYLRQGLTPGDAAARDPAFAKLWYDEPAHQFGRPARYYQQVNALDVESAWAATKAPALVVWGDHDWMMGRDDQARIAELLGPRATLRIRPGMNHHFDVFTDAKKAFDEEDGKFDDDAARMIAQWIRERTQRAHAQ